VIVSQLLAQVAELGIVANSAYVSSLESSPFRRDQLVLIVPRSAGFGRQRHLAFAQTLSHDFVGLSEHSALQQHLALQAEHLGLRMRTRIRLRSFDAVCRMVEAGVGVAVVPVIAAERHAGAGKLRVLKLSDAWADRQLLICARRFEQLSLPALKLVEALCAPHKE
jgi:DNA-binding transcriptional LysR family regulator